MANYMKRHREEFRRRHRKDMDSRRVAERVNEEVGKKVAQFFVQEAMATASKEEANG